MKKIEFIPYAAGKIRRRGVNEDWIKETLNSPDQIVDGYGGRKVAQKKYKLKNKMYLLRVIFEEHEEKLLVITAYLTSQIERYWRG